MARPRARAIASADQLRTVRQAGGPDTLRLCQRVSPSRWATRQCRLPGVDRARAGTRGARVTDKAEGTDRKPVTPVMVNGWGTPLAPLPDTKEPLWPALLT